VHRQLPGLPLIQLDVGSLMSKWVGESERNMREAIRLLEGLGSCVLQLDEIEKGFGGVGGERDGGAAQRAFGIFLKWLSDRSCPVYVVATANNIRALPVEFTRKGRFDELYGVYLPTHAERQEIFGIHLRCGSASPSSSTWMPWPRDRGLHRCRHQGSCPTRPEAGVPRRRRPR
jgi:SpoVK/Ycf46/Vps4 family AAA+-type ATPase